MSESLTFVTPSWSRNDGNQRTFKASPKSKQGIFRVARVNFTVSVSEPSLLVIRHAVVTISFEEQDVIMECMLASRCTAEQIKIFLKETDILGMRMGERKEELTNDRKLWWHKYNYEIPFVHSLFYCIFPPLILIIRPSLSFYTHSLHFFHTFIIPSD